MSSRPDDCRCSSSRIAFAMSGSASCSARQCAAITFDAVMTSSSLFRRADLIDAPLMPAAFEGGAHPDGEDFVREPEGDDASAHREHVRVVVLARQAGGIEIVAE